MPWRPIETRPAWEYSHWRRSVSQFSGTIAQFAVAAFAGKVYVQNKVCAVTRHASATTAGHATPGWFSCQRGEGDCRDELGAEDIGELPPTLLCRSYVVLDASCWHDRAIMRRLPLKAIAVLLLGVWVALAASLAAAQLSGMAAEMAMSAECPGVGQGGCDDCPDGDQQNAAACVAACAMTTVAVLPTALSREAAHAPALPLPLRLSLRGKPSSPDPYPPKPRDLG